MQKFLYLLGHLLALLTISACTQPAKPQYYYRLLANGVIHIEARIPGMPRAEALGDAVEKPSKTPMTLLKGSQQLPNQLQLLVDAQGQLTLQGPGLEVKGLYAFDSGHHRGWLLSLPGRAPWYGGGERTLPLNRLGQRIPLYNNAHYGYELNEGELNFSVPFVHTLAGFGLLFDNPAKGYLDFGATQPGILQAGFESGGLHLYLIPGKTPDEILQNYSTLTGRQPLPPRWALGHFASRFGYRSQQQVQQVVGQLQKENFPVDAAIIDIFWFGDKIQGTLGNLAFTNKQAWPNPAGMMADFRKQGVKTILVTEPFFLQGTKNFTASLPYLAKDSLGKPYLLTDFYFGYGGLLDIFRPDARQWFWQFYKQYTQMGVAGWWGDLGEPEKHPAHMLHNLQSMGISRPVGANEVHNMYGHMWSKMLYQNWQKEYPGRRMFYLNRAGYAGSQRYSVFPWTGDVARTWNGLKAQLPNLQSMSLSGLPYIHSDAGGFSNVPGQDDELYLRWLQMAAFTPILRPHGTAFGEDLDKGVNHLPSEAVYKPEPYKSLARRVIEQRYQLLPYHYTLAWEASTLGKPFIRPMVYYGAADSNLVKATEQYRYGDAFVVAPVTDKAAVTQTLYLPEGNWYNWHNNHPTQGQRWITDSLSLDKIPIYVQAGSFVPLWNAANYQHTGQYSPSAAIAIRYYPSTAQSQGIVYDDDGADPQALKKPAAHQLLKFSGVANASGATIAVEALNWPAGLTRTIHLQWPVNGINQRAIPFDRSVYRLLLNGKPFLAGYSPVSYGSTHWQSIPIDFDGKPVLLELKW